MPLASSPLHHLLFRPFEFSMFSFKLTFDISSGDAVAVALDVDAHWRFVEERAVESLHRALVVQQVTAFKKAIGVI